MYLNTLCFSPVGCRSWQSDTVDFLAGNIRCYCCFWAVLASLFSFPKKARPGRQVVNRAERHRRVKAEAAISVNQSLAPALEILRHPPSFSLDCCNRDTGASNADRATLARVAPPHETLVRCGKLVSRCAQRRCVSLFFGAAGCYTSKKYPLRHRGSCSLVGRQTKRDVRGRKRADQLEILNKIVGGV